ncbi:MAG: hypothetical protein B7X79_19055 [Acidovorax sp. 17-64-282]|nr:MAG: hypothetical protein B7X79_19055 [Acidovorax sp. 17-64-282]
MSNLNALTVAVDVALRKRDEARRLLQDAQGAQQAAQDQLAQLQGYARETEGRWGMRERQQMRREQKQTDERASMQVRNAINGPPGQEY